MLKAAHRRHSKWVARVREDDGKLRPWHYIYLYRRHLKWVVRVKEDDGELRPWQFIYVYSIASTGSQEAAGSNRAGDGEGDQDEYL